MKVAILRQLYTRNHKHHDALTTVSMLVINFNDIQQKRLTDESYIIKKSSQEKCRRKTSFGSVLQFLPIAMAATHNIKTRILCAAHLPYEDKCFQQKMKGKFPESL